MAKKGGAKDKKLKDKKIEIQVRSIFLQGVLLTKKTPLKLKKYHNIIEDWQKWCFRKKLNKVRACLHYVKQFDKISSIIKKYLRF